MSCEEYDTLIHGYLDRELDLLSTLKLEAHLPECRSCSQKYQKNRTVRSVLSNRKLYFKPRRKLVERIHVALQGANKREPHESLSAWKWPRPTPRRAWWSWMGIAASAVLAVTVAWRLGSMTSRPSADDLLVQDVLASHVRSLMANHLTDVQSSDRHTVKPWFNGKVDFSPPVRDLGGNGYPLLGGRLDYLEEKPVAALVYQRQKHFINLFVWPLLEDSQPKTVTRQGYNLFHWAQSGMTFWAVSDLNWAELQEFVRLVQSHDGVFPK